MFESLIVVALAGGLVGVAALGLWVRWDYLFGAGGVLFAIGMAIGVPAGVYYHLLLRRLLIARGVLPVAWWWRPTPLHASVPERHRPRVLRWFRLGAIGFVLVIAGLLLIGVGSLRSE